MKTILDKLKKKFSNVKLEKIRVKKVIYNGYTYKIQMNDVGTLVNGGLRKSKCGVVTSFCYLKRYDIGFRSKMKGVDFLQKLESIETDTEIAIDIHDENIRKGNISLNEILNELGYSND